MRRIRCQIYAVGPRHRSHHDVQARKVCRVCKRGKDTRVRRTDQLPQINDSLNSITKKNSQSKLF